MLRLLQIELYKLYHNKASKVLTIIYFALLTSTALLATINIDFAGVDFNLGKMGVFNFPYIWHLNTYLSAIIKFFLLFVIVAMIANEYSNKTLKQNLIDGLSKTEFILSKFYAVIFFALISTFFVGLITIILGGIYSEESMSLKGMEYLLAYFIKLVGFFSFGMFISLLIKRSVFAIGALIIWNIIEGIIKVICYWVVPKAAETITGLLPLEAMSNLIIEPFSRFSIVQSLANEIGEEISKDFSTNFSDMLIVIIWTGVFVFLSIKLLQKRDL